MEPYGNRGGTSGITAYEIGDDYIAVRFRDRREYTYTVEMVGREALEEMKRLAEEGAGLNTYINRNVRRRVEETAPEEDRAA